MNSNPFEPVSPEPATLEPSDNAPDDFMADNNDNMPAKPARPAVMLDGVSPAPANTFDPNTPPVDIATMGSALAPNEGPFEGSGAGDLNASPVVDNSDSLLNDSDTSSDFLNSTPASTNAADDSTPILSGMLPDDKPAEADNKADKKKAKKDKKADKPARQFTISTASIILFLLAIGGIGGTVYYYMQNNANYDKMKTYQAQVAELENNGTSTSDTENKTSSQFDALQDKITELTTQNEAKQKTLDENKTKIDDLTKKNTDLTKTNEDLTKKVQSISDLTTRVDTMLNKLNTIYPN